MIGKRYTEKELAQHWGITTRTLQRWRAEGVGPAAMMLGKSTVLYRQEDIEAYERRHLHGGEVPEPAKRTMVRAAEALDVILRWKMRDEARDLISSVRDDLRALIVTKKEA